ncbi:unnamed protein product [marine sediment metagenome]|uniref:Uncharacterized protein n=1 Tax=marine sediment metagenome TaxID=412755 RepID=X1FR87_9ZZZZ
MKIKAYSPTLAFRAVNIRIIKGIKIAPSFRKNKFGKLVKR